MKLLDTDTSVEIIRGRADVIRKYRAEADLVATSIVTAAELYYGAFKSRRVQDEIQRLEEFLLEVPPLPLDETAARIFGETKAALEGAGQRLPDADILIAAICLAHRGTLVTGNGRHFARVGALPTEDWIREPLQ